MTRILIVDDEISVGKSLLEYLEDYNFDVDIVESAEEAIKILAVQTFELAIVDLRLPGATGEYLILQANKMDITTCFFIYTGSINYILSDELKSIGIKEKDIFFKPSLDLELFIGRIREVLNE